VRCQQDTELRSLAYLAADEQFAVVALHDVLDEGQRQPGAAGGARPLAANDRSFLARRA
jgi:hypothetical protein